jgi:Spy/CpxP family protein refolding chaperone
MLGFIIGTVCLVGLVRVLHRGRCGHGYGPFDRARGGSRGFGGRWMLRSLFERLETTPGQEKAILGALDELRDNRRPWREELKQTRSDLARGVQSGLIDDATLEETFARHDRLFAQSRVSFVESMKKVTEVLDESQRKKLADLLETGGFFRGGPRWGGPYRTWA